MTRTAILAPAGLPELAELLAGYPDARLVGGGTLEIPAWTAAGAPARGIVLAELPDLRTHGPGHSGAARTLAELASDPEVPGLLRDCAAACATPAVRTLATLGGNVAAARPGCLAAVLLALRATVTVLRGHRQEVVPLTGYLAAPDGVLVRASWPRRPFAGAVRRQTLQERAGAVLLTVAVTRGDDGWTVAAAGNGVVPQRLTTVEHLLSRGPVRPPHIAAAAAQDLTTKPWAMLPADYQRHLAGVLISRAVGDVNEEI